MTKTTSLQIRVKIDSYDKIRNNLKILAANENCTMGEILEKITDKQIEEKKVLL